MLFRSNPYPETKTQVNHKDGNKRNFEVDNLEWCSPAENLQHCSIKLGAKGENLYNASLSDDQVHIICRMLLDGLRPKDIANIFNVTTDAIRKIRAGDTYFHVRSLYDIPHTYLSEFSESTVILQRMNTLLGYLVQVIMQMQGLFITIKYMKELLLVLVNKKLQNFPVLNVQMSSALPHIYQGLRSG